LQLYKLLETCWQSWVQIAFSKVCTIVTHYVGEPLLQVCDALEDLLAEGGNIVDYHGCDFFPERWVAETGAVVGCGALLAV